MLRSTQFFELISDLAQRSSGSDVAIAPVLVQPISSDDLADALTEIALGRPQIRTIEVAGPERLRLDELTAWVLAAYEDSRRVVADSDARYFGVELDDRSLLPDARARLAPSRFEDWLRQTLQPEAYVPLEWPRRTQPRMTTHTKG
jgi:uncharacterized protein YbjT (DUF2867 family)